jgi:hypothetical protein
MSGQLTCCRVIRPWPAGCCAEVYGRMPFRDAIGRMVPTRVRRTWSALTLPPDLRAAKRKDSSGQRDPDPGPEVMVEVGLDWLLTAQRCSASHDGGFARHYSFIDGWSTSYPETTGYITPTLLDHAERRPELKDAAIRTLDWLADIQFPEGGFQGGVIGHANPIPVTFNTGQILIGLADGTRRLSPDYLQPMRKAAQWLVDTQSADGAWRRFPTPFAAPGEKAYETHVAWGLFEAERADPGRGYGESGMRNVEWVLEKKTRPNGWIADCCLTNPAAPLTHTLGYALRGILEAHRLSGERRILERALPIAAGLRSALQNDGFLPGRLNPDWSPAARWVCLTGSAQVAHCWLMLYELTGDSAWKDAASSALAYVRSTVRVEGADAVRGGVQGSYPIHGDYGTFELLNWACKFTIDASALELRLR